MRNYAKTLHKIFKLHMFWTFIRITSGNSNKYPKYMFYEKIKIKQGLYYIPFCPLKILYNSEFTIMATNAVILTRVHCIKALPQNTFGDILLTRIQCYFIKIEITLNLEIIQMRKKLEKVSIGHGCPHQMPFRKRVYM